MQSSKVSCSSCAHYIDCSARTRMYINYCGSNRDSLKSEISVATEDCKNKRGLIFKYEVITSVSKLKENIINLGVIPAH